MPIPLPDFPLPQASQQPPPARQGGLRHARPDGLHSSTLGTCLLVRFRHLPHLHTTHLDSSPVALGAAPMTAPIAACWNSRFVGCFQRGYHICMIGLDHLDLQVQLGRQQPQGLVSCASLAAVALPNRTKDTHATKLLHACRHPRWSTFPWSRPSSSGVHFLGGGLRSRVHLELPLLVGSLRHAQASRPRSFYGSTEALVTVLQVPVR